MKGIHKVDIYLNENGQRKPEIILKVILALIPIVIVVSSLFIFDVKPIIFSKTKFEADIPNMVQPQSSKQSFKYLELANGMKGMLVSDPKEVKASAAVRVDAGAGEDPLEFAGTAHLLEHVLHLGTKKYPSDQDYKYTLTKNGGSSNTFTSDECTTYFFAVNNGALAKVLDIFSTFFEAPLFDKATIEKEANAVHSEHEKNLVSDGRRFYQMIRDLSDKDHPFNRFTTGSLDTLLHTSKGDDITETLKKFYRKHYIASKMTFTIVGNYPLNELEEMAIKYFSNVNTQEKSFDSEIEDSKKDLENKKEPKKVTFASAFALAYSNEPLTEKSRQLSEKIPSDKAVNLFAPGRFKESNSLFSRNKNSTLFVSKPPSPFLERAFRKSIVYDSVGSLKTLSIVIPYSGSKAELESYEEYFNFIDKFLTHTSSNCLYGKLKKGGLIQSLSSWYDRSSDDSRIFVIRFSLTDSGLDKTEKIFSIVYSFFERMRKDIDKLNVEEQTFMDYLNFVFGFSGSAVGTALHFVRKPSADPTYFMRDHVQLDYSKEKFLQILNKITPDTSLMVIGRPELKSRFAEKKTGLDKNTRAIETSMADIDETEEKHKRTIDTILEIPMSKNQNSCEKCEVMLEDSVSLPDEYEVSSLNPKVEHKGSSPSLVSNKNPKNGTAAVSQKEIPTAAVSQKEIPTAAVSQKEIPTAAVSQKEIPTAAVSQKEIPTAAVSQKEIPTAAVSLKSSSQEIFKLEVNEVKKYTNSLYKFDYKVGILPDGEISKLRDQSALSELQVSFPEANKFLPSDISIKFTQCAVEPVNSTLNSNKTFLAERNELSSPMVFSPFFSKVLKKFNANEDSSISEECKESQMQEDRKIERSDMYANDSGMSLLYKTARHFKLPKTQVRIRIYNHELIDSVFYTFAKIDAAIMNEMIKDKLSDALQFSTIRVSTSSEGYFIKIESFSSLINKLLQSVLDIFSKNENEESEELFNQIKERFSHGLKDFKVRQPLGKAAAYLENMLYKDSPLPSEIYSKLKDLTFAQYKEKIGDIREALHYRVVFFGNVLEKDMDEVNKMVRDTLKLPRKFSYVEKQMPIVKLPEESHLVIRFANENPSDVNNAVINYYQFGRLNTRERIILSFIIGPLRSTAFNHIRTRKQMGYIVSAGIENENKVYGLKVMAQGSFASCLAMEREIEEALNIFHNYIVDELDQASIDDFLKTLRNKRKQEDFEFQGYLEWLKFDEDFILKIPNFTKEDVHEFFEKYFIQMPKKLSVQVYSQKKKEHLEDVLQGKENISGRSSKLVTDRAYFREIGYYE